MPVRPRDILQAVPVLRTKNQRNTFRTVVQAYAEELGFSSQLESLSFGGRNLLIGDPEKAQYLLAAKCGPKQDAQLLALLEIMAAMPEIQYDRVCFLLYEGDGLLKNGVKSHYGTHKPSSDHQLMLSLDTVGIGDKLVMVPTKQLKANRRKLTSLYKACGYFGKKSLLVDETQTASMAFPYGISLQVKKEKKKSKGKKLVKQASAWEETNINILRAALVSFLCCDAAK